MKASEITKKIKAIIKNYPEKPQVKTHKEKDFFIVCIDNSWEYANTICIRAGFKAEYMTPSMCRIKAMA